MSSNNLFQEDYDAILDALDNEDTKSLIKYFQEFDINPLTELLDSPRLGHLDNELYTYLDYVISYNLTSIIDMFIDDLNLEINDDIIARCLVLHNLDSYKYFCDLGYIPDSETLKIAVQLCYAEICDEILCNDSDLIDSIEENDIDFIYSIDIGEETIETVKVLFNYGIKPYLFSNFLSILKEQKETTLEGDIEIHIIDEIIDILYTNGVVSL
jgi:hypothetical protein